MVFLVGGFLGWFKRPYVQTHTVITRTDRRVKGWLRNGCMGGWVGGGIGGWVGLRNGWMGGWRNGHNWWNWFMKQKVLSDRGVNIARELGSGGRRSPTSLMTDISYG
jgi:hypothetical protein